MLQSFKYETQDVIKFCTDGVNAGQNIHYIYCDPVNSKEGLENAWMDLL